MDISDPDLILDEEGVCNHCRRYDIELPKRVFSGEIAKVELEKIVYKIKQAGKGKDYDCIIGVSGGVDSTYVAYLSKQLGLRPLAIHFDNGWNSELAVANIEKTLNKLGIDLYTFVINWDEFRDLQKSFLKASTPDGEIPTDHAINALLFQEASKHNIKYIISGMNFATESMAVKSWAYGHSDWTYIKDIQSKFGTKKLKQYPHFSLFSLFYYTFIKKIKVVSVLNYVEYNKADVMEKIIKELEWVYYGGKHYESVYTRFYQGYILPQKFNIDKRRGHLSDLINSGQMKREDALEEMKENTYLGSLLTQDLRFVKKKLELSDDEFQTIMDTKPKSFRDYKNIEHYIVKLKKMVNYLRNKGLYTK
jgi:N-acetyl sugar amidotransferase